VVIRELDLAFVADQLRARRTALQPEDVGLPRGLRRRTPGLRREEAAALCAMSLVHYGRLERRCGPRPSELTLARAARGLRFGRRDRDRLFAAAGYDPARRSAGTGHVAPALMHVLTRLADTPALLLDEFDGVLYRTRAATALVGLDDASSGCAPARCHVAHRELGAIALHRAVLVDGDLRLVIYTAAPGSELALELATVLGTQSFDVPSRR
jgi:hypothetical protein